MRHLTILVDMDGVLGDFPSAFLSAYKRHGGCDAPDAVTEYEFIAPLQDKTALAETWADSCIWTAQRPYPGAFIGLLQLYTDHDVLLVTDPGPRPDIAVPAKLRWLKRHADWLNPRRVMFTTRKELVRGDVLIDDKPSNVTGWLRVNPDKRAYLVARSWNEEERYVVTRAGGCVLFGELDSIAPPVVIA